MHQINLAMTSNFACVIKVAPYDISRDASGVAWLHGYPLYSKSQLPDSGGYSGGHGGFLVVACVWLRAQSAL